MQRVQAPIPGEPQDRPGALLQGGAWVSYILGAPDFVNGEFRELAPDGLPAITPLVAKSEVSSSTN